MQTQTLGALCELVVDCPHSTPIWTDSGMLVLRSPNIRGGRLDLSNKSFTDEKHYQERIKRAKPSAGDIIITREAPMGEVCILPDDLECCLGQRMVLLRPDKSKVYGRYLLYALQSEPVQHQIFWAEGTGSTVSNLRIPHLKALKIPVPPLAEQCRIAHILGTLDDKIELNRQLNATLEQLARALFQSWFVDFDPVRAKASGEAADSICRRLGLTPELLALFPAELEASALGAIPEGWQVMPVGDALEAVGGGTPSTAIEDYWHKGTYHWATPKDLSKMTSPILLDTERRVTKRGLNTISSGLMPRDTVLLSSRAPVGYLAISAVPISINQGFIALKCSGPVSYYYTYLWCLDNMEAIKSRASGTTFLEISKKSFRPIPMLVPTQDIMNRFTQLLEPIFGRIEESTRESTQLAQLRDELLPQLLSGSLKVD